MFDALFFVNKFYVTTMDECPICYSDMKHHFIILHCGHIFHKKCINTWAQRSCTCPYCRQEFKLEQLENEKGNNIIMIVVLVLYVFALFLVTR